METLVNTEWLSVHLDDPDLVLLDCTVVTMPEEDGGFRNVSGRPDYELGHIPNAGFADLMVDLADTSSEYEFTLPDPKTFCEAMGKLGVGDNSKVVLYDMNYQAWAARVWWMLRWVGFDRAALLDGGMSAWTSERRPLSTEKVIRTPKHLTLNLRPELIADHDEVLADISDDSISIIDTMPAEYYRGEMTMYARPGHIPHAVNIDSLRLLDEKGHFRSEKELAAMHQLDHRARTITYCGGGILAALEAFVLTRLGFNNVAVYIASLQEWADDPANPMEIGAPSLH